MTLLKGMVRSPEQEEQSLSQGLPLAETSRGQAQAPCASHLPLLLGLQDGHRNKLVGHSNLRVQDVSCKASLPLMKLREGANFRSR